MTCNISFRRQHHYLHRLQQYRLFFLLYISIGLTTAVDERIREIRPGRHADVDRFDEVYSIVRNTFLIACAPVIILFLSSIFRDPMLPRTLRMAWSSIMRNIVLGNLSCGGGGGSDSYSSRTDIWLYLHFWRRVNFRYIRGGSERKYINKYFSLVIVITNVSYLNTR